MKHLIKVTNTYRVPNVEDVLSLRQELSNLKNGELVKFSYQEKSIKAKGEIIDTYQLVTATLSFNDEKDPDSNVEAYYDYPKKEELSF